MNTLSDSDHYDIWKHRRVAIKRRWRR